MMGILRMTLKKKWWDLTFQGEKDVEIRDDTVYWRTRIKNASPVEAVHFTLGYPKDGIPVMKRKVLNITTLGGEIFIEMEKGKGL